MKIIFLRVAISVVWIRFLSIRRVEGRKCLEGGHFLYPLGLPQRYNLRVKNIDKNSQFRNFFGIQLQNDSEKIMRLH